jgi:hypothetical protein
MQNYTLPEDWGFGYRLVICCWGCSRHHRRSSHARAPEKAFAEGKSQTMSGRHLTGEVVDVVAYVDGVVSRNLPLYRKISATFKQVSQELNTPIGWGGD